MHPRTAGGVLTERGSPGVASWANSNESMHRGARTGLPAAGWEERSPSDAGRRATVGDGWGIFTAPAGCELRRSLNEVEEPGKVGEKTLRRRKNRNGFDASTDTESTGDN